MGERTLLIGSAGVEYIPSRVGLKEIETDLVITSTCVVLVEEPTGLALVQSVSQLEGQVIFAPGPRGLMIPKDRLGRNL